ncbi:MAG: 4-carboxy-4-hydroxy-2-oxoadipate aldolase/oxaloacetate decarboxylase [Acidimicrobiia bacterium]
MAHHGTIVRKIRRAAPDVIAGLEAAGVATVHEAGATSLLPPEIRPIQEGARIAGSAVTVSCPPGDNIMIHAAVEVIEPGDVLVVATTSPTSNGMFGELLAVSVTTRGCHGLVIDAGVRDVADLRGMGFPVWARTIHAAGTTKAGLGAVNLPVLCAGVSVRPGDVVVADDDGVVVIERERAKEVLEAARGRVQKEEETRSRLAAGELGLDIYGFRQRLADLGVRWVDTFEE